MLYYDRLKVAGRPIKLSYAIENYWEDRFVDVFFAL